jgi:hypothetical protein
MMLEAALLYVGGLSLGGFAGYGVALYTRDPEAPMRARIFAGEDSMLMLCIILVGAISGPFILHAITRKWPILTYPVLTLCALIIVGEIAFLGYMTAGK